MRLAVWTPLPPSTSGVADWSAEVLPALARHHEVRAVVDGAEGHDRSPLPGVEIVGSDLHERQVDGWRADLNFHQIGNSPAHVFAYRAALRHVGVVQLHEWTLHDLAWREASDRGDLAGYVREMRYSHGAEGSFMARQVVRGIGGTLLPSLFAANDRLLERCLGVVALTRQTAARLARRRPGVPRLQLVQHGAVSLDPLPSVSEARRSLGLPERGLILTSPGLATKAKRLDVLVRVAARLRESQPDLLLVVAGAADPELPLREWARDAGIGDGLRVTGRLALPDLVRHLVAADVVASLRFPSRGEMSAVLARSLAVGRPVLVTAGTPGAEEFPEGIVVPVDPGPREDDELEALLSHLLAHPALRGRIGRLAREYAAAHLGVDAVAARLASFLEDVHERRDELRRLLVPDGRGEGTLEAYLRDEVTHATRDLGLAGLPLALGDLLSSLAGGRR